MATTSGLLNHLRSSKAPKVWLKDRTSSRFTRHFAPGTSHVAPRTSHLALRTSHFAPRTSHLALRTSHVARRTSHVARRTSPFALVPRALSESAAGNGRGAASVACPAAPRHP
jgi:hypothetical protein